ncbi:hypothetical protein GPALN_010894 [Globodera pallida]|nr:hypothetical protein GPALN_010894 [Globodera pallida]
MRIPTPLLAANFVLAAAICAAIFALGLWLFVLNNKTLNTVENTVEKSAIHGTMEEFFDTDGMSLKTGKNNQQIRQMEQPIQLEEFGMASMGDGKKVVGKI